MTLPRLLLLVLLVFACAVLGVAVVALSEREDPSPAGAIPAAGPVTDGAVAVLRDWDRKRTDAWAAGDVDALRSLYTRRSVAGARDAARLSRWVDRGLRVRRMRIQVLRVRVLEERRALLVLSVTDRIDRAVAVSGRASIRLPDDSLSTWRITMRLVQGEWRVASVER